MKQAWNSSNQTSLNSIPNSTQIDWKLCVITDTEVFTLSQSCGQESRSTSMRLVSKCVVQQCLFPSFHYISLKNSTRMFNLNCFNTTSSSGSSGFNTILNFILISWKVWEKMKPWYHTFAQFTFWLPGKVRASESSVKWYKSMVATGMAGMKKIWLKILRAMSNIEVFA